MSSLVWRLLIEKSDPRFQIIKNVNAEYRKKNSNKYNFFASWGLSRLYSKAEIAAARLFFCKVTKKFEPAGEECGTRYDEAAACPICGAGAPQVTPLSLKLSSIPKTADIAQTIAGEIVVSRQLIEIFEQNRITGFSYAPLVTQKGMPASDHWFQLHDGPRLVDLSPETVTGVNPFHLDPENKYRCPNGDTIGLNLISEVRIAASSWVGTDINFTRQFIGHRLGLLRPERLLIVSPKVRALVMAHKLKGFQFEVAYLV